MTSSPAPSGRSILTREFMAIGVANEHGGDLFCAGCVRTIPGMSLRPDALTWTALLSKWIEFAQSSVALPDDAEGQRWRKCVPSIITLQAVTFALGDLERLPTEERPLARDKAEILIRDHLRRIETVWRGVGLPPMLLEIVEDAHRQWRYALYAGLIELIWRGEKPWIVPALKAEEYTRGTLAVMQPGTIVMPEEPVAWCVDGEIDRLESALGGCVRQTPPGPRQVYRQIDDHGRITHDLICPLETELPAGLPLLVPLLERGERIGHLTLDPEAWLAQQRASMTSAMIPVDDQTGPNARSSQQSPH